MSDKNNKKHMNYLLQIHSKANIADSDVYRIDGTQDKQTTANFEIQNNESKEDFEDESKEDFEDELKEEDNFLEDEYEIENGSRVKSLYKKKLVLYRFENIKNYKTKFDCIYLEYILLYLGKQEHL